MNYLAAVAIAVAPGAFCIMLFRDDPRLKALGVMGSVWLLFVVSLRAIWG